MKGAKSRDFAGLRWHAWWIACAAAACSASPTEPVSERIAMQADRLAATAQRSCLIEDSGEVVCWGLGGPARITPGDGSLKFVAVSGGWDHLCGLTADSTAYC